MPAVIMTAVEEEKQGEVDAQNLLAVLYQTDFLILGFLQPSWMLDFSNK